MLFAGVILTLLAVTLVSFLVGAFWLAKYASRLSPAQAALVLLVPPYTFYFAFYKLQVDGKERATALWMFGLAATLLLGGVFFQPLTVIASGNVAQLDPIDPEEEKRKMQEKLAKELEEQAAIKAKERAAEEEKRKAEEAANFKLDMALICEEIKNPVLAELPEDIRGATMAQNIAQGLKSDRGKNMFRSFAKLDGPKKAAALDAAAKELAMTGCTMADVWRAQPPAPAAPEAPKP
jgi:hypothetical protein